MITDLTYTHACTLWAVKRLDVLAISNDSHFIHKEFTLLRLSGCFAGIFEWIEINLIREERTVR